MEQNNFTLNQLFNVLLKRLDEYIDAKVQEVVSKNNTQYNASKDSELQEPQLMTVAETAKALGISKHYLYKMMSEKRIPYYKPRGKVAYFKRSEVEQMTLTNRIEAKRNAI